MVELPWNGNKFVNEINDKKIDKNIWEYENGLKDLEEWFMKWNNMKI